MNFSGLKQVKCTLTRHVPPAKAENELLEGHTLTIETECERCHAPIILERDENERDYYYITEYIEIED